MRPELQKLLRFGVVGAAGFGVDAGLLYVLIFGHFDPVPARFVSASVAVLTTYMLNKTWTFAEPAKDSDHRALGPYLLVQGFGFICNILVFALALSVVGSPLIALVIASGTAMFVNYIGSRYWVFNERR